MNKSGIDHKDKHIKIEDEDLDDIDDESIDDECNITEEIKSISIEDNERNRLAMIERVKSGEFMKIAAPMVRFSRLPFRLLCKKWGCDITYSPMFLAEAFNRSQYARDSDFSTNIFDDKLIIQFAANSAEELSAAAEKVANHCIGVDINCGCPQKWVMKEGYGAGLLKHPDKIADMVRQTTNRVGLPCSVKIRVDRDLQKTVELVRQVEAAGVSWLTVHGRTSAQRSSHPVDYEAIKLVKESVQIPVFANGDIFTLDNANEVRERTNVNGVMSARGILCNPALFKGYNVTPPECISDFVNIYTEYGGLHPNIFHRHLMYMLFDVHNKNEKLEFNRLNTTAGIIDYLNDKYFN